MAALPPRKGSQLPKTNRRSASPKQILLQMGFPTHRAEKALAATGERGVQLASDWLLTHVNDPTLDDNMPREYILYACPTGPLLEQLHAFWNKSLVQCDRNGAHNYLPHVTLCSFFKAPDNSVCHLVRSLMQVVDRFRNELPEQLALERYTSSTFIGLFVVEEHAEILKKLAVQYVKEIANHTSSVEPYMKSLHVTLAYQFSLSHYEILDALSQAVDSNAPAQWDVRLYSRDSRIAGNEVHKVLYSHIPSESDELELLIGDYVYVNGDQLNNSADGWVEGTSWLTGNTGFLPKTYIEKTAESDAWTLHRSVPLTKNGLDEAEDLAPLHSRHVSNALLCQKSQSREKLAAGPQSLTPAESGPDLPLSSSRNSIYENVEALYAKINKPKKQAMTAKPRKVIVVRHGERIDFTFGDWIPSCFDESGNYVRCDLNMPKSIPPRKGGPQDYFKDCPLTEIGLRQASLVGEAMADSGMSLTHVYCSPSLRCVQTCDNILTGMNQRHLPICIEPGLFEWLAWYQDFMPEWLSLQELQEIGYNIEMNYRPYITTEELHDRREACEQYYMRSYYVAQSIVKSTMDKGGNILLVGHAATLDTCTRQLCGKEPRNASDMTRLIHRIPYCSVAMVEEENPDAWVLVNPPCPSVTHSNNIRFDWKVMLD